MLYREIIAVCSQIHTKHINTLCGQNVELLNVKLVERTVTTGLWRVENVLDPIRKDMYHQAQELHRGKHGSWQDKDKGFVRS